MKKNKQKKQKGKKNTASKPASQQKKRGGLGQPYGDRVLVKPIAAEEMTSFGLIIPDTAKEKPEQGMVVAVGPGKKNEEGKVVPLSVKTGDRIMFSKYGFDEIKVNGVEYYLIREDSITYIF